MYNRVFVLGKEGTHVATVRQTILRIQSWGPEHMPAQFPNLFIVSTFARPVSQKIELYKVAIYMAIVIHEHGLKSSSIHNINYL